MQEFLRREDQVGEFGGKVEKYLMLNDGVLAVGLNRPLRERVRHYLFDIL